MKQYEITYLTKEDLKEKEVKAEIEGLGGKIVSVSPLGQKSLVYPIRKEKSAYYTSVVFGLDEEKVSDLNKKLGLKDEILRHLIIIYKAMPQSIARPKKEKEVPKVEEKVIEIEAAQKEKPAPKEKIEEDLSADRQEKKIEKVEEIKESSKVIEKPKPKKVEKPKKQEEEISEEDRLKALDEKLDELLKE